MRNSSDAEEDRPVIDSDDGRLESWKEIATYLRKDVKTVQRWEKRAGLPVHRHSDPTILSVYAFRPELDAWRERARPSNGDGEAANGAATGPWTNPRVAAAVLGAVALTAVLAWVVSSNRAGVTQFADSVPPFQQDDYVLISQFDNLTGEPLFDEGTLETALERALSESGFLHVAPPERVEDVLRLMQRPLDTVIDTRVGREVALRDGGIQVVLAGGIERSGPGYVLTLELVDPQDGQILHSARDEAVGEAYVSTAIYRLASQVRQHLGEAPSLIEASEQRLQRVTTPSLRALQLYSRGYDLYRVPGSRDVPAAAELFRLAIREDPSFAAAHNMLAWSMRYQDVPLEEYLPYLERAVELAEGATDRDRLFIEGCYFSLTGQYEKAVPKFEALLELDPGHHYGLNNLEAAYSRLGREPPVERIVHQADVRPNHVGRQSRAIAVLVDTHQLERARIHVDRTRVLLDSIRRIRNFGALHNVFAQVTFFPAYEHWVNGEIEEALEEVDTLARTDEAFSSLIRWRYVENAGRFYLSLGQLRKAEHQFESLPEARRHFLLAELAETLNDRRGLREHMRAFMALPPDDLQPNDRNFMLQVRAGLSPDPVAVAREGWEQPLIEGELAFRRGDWRDAIASLEQGVEPLWSPSTGFHSWRFVTPAQFYLATESLATASLEAGDEARALYVLERAAQARPKYLRGGIFGANARFRIQARLAREYRKLGRVDEAVAIEDDVLHMLKYADADHPIVLQINEARGSQSETAAQD